MEFMKKKISSLILTLVMMFSIGNIAFASSTVKDSSEQFSTDTVITESNLYDILKHYGIDPSAVKKTDTKATVKLTVSDLENAINYVKTLPSEVVDRPEIPYDTESKSENTQELIAPTTTSTKTVYKTATITSSLVMEYSATGKYYSSDTTKYWIDAYGGNIKVDTPPTPTWWYEIERINKLVNSVKNPSTSSSYLQLDYDYVVGYYLGVGGYGVKLNETSVKGYTNFDKSYI